MLIQLLFILLNEIKIIFVDNIMVYRMWNCFGNDYAIALFLNLINLDL